MAKALRGEIEAELAGKKYTLRLGIGELEEIENATGLGPLACLNSFGTNARIAHTVAVLSQAISLDGKRKLGPTQARKLMEDAGLGESVSACVRVLSSVLIDDTPGNVVAAVAGDPTTAA